MAHADEEITRAGLPLLHPDDSHAERTDKLTQHYQHLNERLDRDSAYEDGEHPLYEHHQDHGVPSFNHATHSEVAPHVRANIASYLSRHIAKTKPSWPPSVDIEHARESASDGVQPSEHAIYHPYGNHIVVNHAVAHDPDEGGDKGSGWYAHSGDTSPLGHVLAHEYGHFLKHQLKDGRGDQMLHEVSGHIPGATRYDGGDAEHWLAQNHEPVSRHVGGYAATHPEELVAELYAEHHHSPDPSAAAQAVGRHLGDRTVSAMTAQKLIPEPGVMLRTAARDRDFGFEVTASWSDVQRKAKRIRAEGGVTIVIASNDGIGGRVKGDHGTYEALLVYRPGTHKVADWTCGCKWAAYAFDRSPAFSRFEGRKCFLPGTKVSMADGTHKPIEQVQPGDRVLTHDGVGTVRNLWNNHYNGEVVGLTRNGSSRQVWATADHGMLANTSMRGNTGSPSTKSYRDRKAVRDKSAWKRADAGALQVGDWLMGTYADAVQTAPTVSLDDLHEHVVLRDGRGRLETPTDRSGRIYAGASLPEFAFTDEFAVLLGYYLAEGHVEHQNRHGVPRIVQWTFGAHEDGYVAEISGALETLGAGTPRIYRHHNRILIKVSNAALALLLARLTGTHAAQKSLHPDLMQAPPEFQETLLRTYLNGDGCESMATTASKELGRQIVTLGCRVGHYIPREHTTMNNRGPLNREKGQPIYYVETAGRYMQGRERLWENFYGARITGVERRQYHGPVYNLNVDDQHTYAVEDTVVFNCSHALALQFEAQSQGMFGKEVHPSEPTGRERSIVRYDPDADEHVYARPYAGSLIGSLVARLRAEDADPAEVIGGLVQAGVRHRTAVLLWKSAEHEGERRCPHCGGFIGVEALEHHHCPHCGAPLGGESHEHHREGAKQHPGPHVSGIALKAHDTGRVLMLQRGLDDEKDPARGLWELPGGHHEEGDRTSLHAGIREFEEEVGQEFPLHGVVKHTWTSPNGVYQGHVVVIPSEKDLSMKDGRVVPNPDDPKGDCHEQAAWWTIEHAKKNPALRPEVKAHTPWKEIEKASLDTEKTAAAWDPISNVNPQPGRGTSEPAHSNTTNPASTGWAAGEDPDNWDNLDANPEPLTPSLGFDAVLHDEPEPALPTAYGDEDATMRPAEMTPADLDPIPDNPPAQMVPDQDANIHLLDGGSSLPNSYHASAPESRGVADVIAAFQRTAAGQELLTAAASKPDDDIAAAAKAHLAKEAAAKFDFAEQQELINEGNDGRKARNLGDLKIEGTHYELLEAALAHQDADPSDIFS